MINIVVRYDGGEHQRPSIGLQVVQQLASVHVRNEESEVSFRDD